jgi:hypothetical protein
MGPGHSEGPEPSRVENSDPMREAGAANRRKLLLRFGQFCVRPTGDSYGRTTHAPEQRFNGANLTATLEVG